MTTAISTPDDVPIWRREANALVSELIAEAHRCIDTRATMNTLAGQTAASASADVYRIAAFKVSKLAERVRAAELAASRMSDGLACEYCGKS